MTSTNEYDDRRRAADAALANVAAEGGTPSDEARQIIERAVAGVITTDEAVRLIAERQQK